jgi:hypothetical protein
METVFFKLIVRKIMRLKKHIELHQANIVKLHDEHEVLRGELKTSHYMTLPSDHADRSFVPYAKGVFEDGVELRNDPNQSAVPCTEIAQDSNGEPVRYQFLDENVEVAP